MVATVANWRWNTDAGMIREKKHVGLGHQSCYPWWEPWCQRAKQGGRECWYNLGKGQQVGMKELREGQGAPALLNIIFKSIGTLRPGYPEVLGFDLVRQWAAWSQSSQTLSAMSLFHACNKTHLLFCVLWMINHWLYTYCKSLLFIHIVQSLAA